MALNNRGQLLDLTIHTQQHLDDDLSPRVIDRASFFQLHTTKFDRPELCPPDPLNAYANQLICRTFEMPEEGLEPPTRGL